MLSTEFFLKIYDSCYQFELIVSSAIKCLHFPARPSKPCSEIVHVIRHVIISRPESLTQRFILITMINILCDQRLQVSARQWRNRCSPRHLWTDDNVSEFLKVSSKTRGICTRMMFELMPPRLPGDRAKPVKEIVQTGTCGTPSVMHLIGFTGFGDWASELRVPSHVICRNCPSQLATNSDTEHWIWANITHSQANLYEHVWCRFMAVVVVTEAQTVKGLRINKLLWCEKKSNTASFF